MHTASLIPIQVFLFFHNYEILKSIGRPQHKASLLVHKVICCFHVWEDFLFVNIKNTCYILQYIFTARPTLYSNWWDDHHDHSNHIHDNIYLLWAMILMGPYTGWVNDHINELQEILLLNKQDLDLHLCMLALLTTISTTIANSFLDYLHISSN